MSIANSNKIVRRFDPHAVAFINAAGITSSLQKNAINTLCLSLKSYGLWNKMIAVYPFIGGTASSHKFNLIEARDSDSAFRLGFNGGIIHSVTGMQPNGTNGYANTNINVASKLSLNDCAVSVYSRTNTATNTCMVGVSFNFNVLYSIELFPTWGGTTAYFSLNNKETSVANNNSSGLFILNRPNSTTLKLHRNSSILANYSITATGLVNDTLTLGKMNSSGVNTEYYDNREQAFATVGYGLTDAESLNLYTVIQAFNTSLNRNI